MIQIIECCVCRKMSKGNLILMGSNICTNCEKAIVKLQGDSKEYSLYKERVKGLLKNNVG